MPGIPEPGAHQLGLRACRAACHRSEKGHTRTQDAVIARWCMLPLPATKTNMRLSAHLVFTEPFASENAAASKFVAFAWRAPVTSVIAGHLLKFTR